MQDNTDPQPFVLSLAKLRGGKTHPIVQNIVLLCFITRFLVGSSVLNQVIHYTDASGSGIEKIHPATYVLLFSMVIHLLSRSGLPPIRFLVGVGLTILAIVISLFDGGLNAAATIVDTLLAGFVFAWFCLEGGRDFQLQLRKLLGFCLTANLFIMIYESVAGRRIIGGINDESYFRAAGFLDHPLFVGYTCCFFLATMNTGRTSGPRTILLSLALFLETILAGVRLPLIISGMLVGLQAVTLPNNNVLEKWVLRFGMLIISVGIFIAAWAKGLLFRFSELGLFDSASAGSRILSWEIFRNLPLGDLLWGVGNDRVAAYLHQYNLETIENSFVAYTLFAGIFVAIITHLAVLTFFLKPVRQQLVLGLVLIGALSGSIILSAKSAVLPFAFVSVATALVGPARMFRVRVRRRIPGRNESAALSAGSR